MPLPAAARLIDFGLLRNQDNAGDVAARHGGAMEARETTESLVARAREEGLAAGRAEKEAALEAQAAEFEARLDEERAAWAEREGAEFAERMEAAFGALGAEVEEGVAAILAPLLEEAVRDRIVQDLVAALDTLLAGEAGPLVEISGPQDLLSRLGARLGARAKAVTFAPSGGVEIKVVAERTVIETQLGHWLKRIGARGE